MNRPLSINIFEKSLFKIMVLNLEIETVDLYIYVTLKAEFYRMSTFHKIIFIESLLSIWNVDFL